MSSRFEPKVDRLVTMLEEGLGSEAASSVRAELGHADDTEDAVVARSLVQIVAACGVAHAGRGDGPEIHDDVEESADDIPVIAADSSLMGQIAVDSRDAISVDELDVLTLGALLRGGGLRQRRAALKALLDRWVTYSRDQIRLVTDYIHTARDVEIDGDLARAREQMSGAAGRKARAERDQWWRAVEKLEEKIGGFWEGEHRVEPVADLPGDESAAIVLRARELPDSVVHHLAAVLEGVDGVSSRKDRRALLESLRYSGDARLVPSLVDLLETELVGEAARALRRIDDPRVRHALAAAYERSVLDTTKVVLAGALGEHGDRRALDYVRELLERDDKELTALALEALETLGRPEDCTRIAAFLDERVLARAAVQTLGRTADMRALDALRLREERTNVSAMRAAIEDARESILARMELRGEELGNEDTRVTIPPIRDEDRPKTSTGTRFKGFRYYLIGQLWLAFGGFARGIARLERAAQLRPSWARPWIAIAMSYVRRRRHAKALAAFRRAVETDRRMVERNPIFVRALAQCFLRRAEQVERDGRRDVARGLLGEVLDLDLRRAPSAMRFEIQRRSRSLQRTA